MPFGLTSKTMPIFVKRLADKLHLPEEQVEQAMLDITREDVMRVAKNERGVADGQQ